MKMNCDKHHGSCLVMHWMGLLLTGSPLAYVYPPQIPLSSKKKPAHFPLEREGATAASSLLRGLRVEVKPTSLRREEGLEVGSLPVVGHELWQQGRGGGGGGTRESKPKSTVIWLMAV